MSDWEFKELRPLFEKLIEEAHSWDPPKVLPRTQQLGKIIIPQLETFEKGKYRRDRNEAIGFFEAITKFAQTGLPISLDHFTDLVNQYRERISPYPHYSGIKLKVPIQFDKVDNLSPEDVPEDLDQDDEEDLDDGTLKLM